MCCGRERGCALSRLSCTGRQKRESERVAEIAVPTARLLLRPEGIDDAELIQGARCRRVQPYVMWLAEQAVAEEEYVLRWRCDWLRLESHE
jgi:hypothetical protein